VTESGREVGDELRWTRTEQRHLTLRFFGAVDDVDALTESVAESFLPSPRFSVSIGGGGAFPSARRASVLWLGVREGSSALSALAAAVREPDDQPFRAHLTLARVNRARDLRPTVAALDACGTSPSWTVDEVVLFDSHLRTDGTDHTEVARFRLAG
jgi:2'-5' RNA ligase